MVIALKSISAPLLSSPVHFSFCRWFHWRFSLVSHSILKLSHSHIFTLPHHRSLSAQAIASLSHESYFSLTPSSLRPSPLHRRQSSLLTRIKILSHITIPHLPLTRIHLPSPHHLHRYPSLLAAPPISSTMSSLSLFQFVLLIFTL
jgi:hypothetical protein